MATQVALPLLLDDLPGESPVDAAARRPRGVEYRQLRTREVLQRAGRSRQRSGWTLNPYRGCEFGCPYCFARATHRFLGFGDDEAFERQIFVKKDAGRQLLRRLRRSLLTGRPIALGTVTDPYQPAELRHRVTRQLLEAMRRCEGLTVTITTRSPLVTRDLELLTRLNRKHAVSVEISLATLDPRLSDSLEPRAPAPRDRVAAAARLAAAGIPLTLLCAPLLPGINAGSRQLLPIFEAARRNGAADLRAVPLSLEGPARPRFWSWLRGEFPHLVPRYRRLYRGRSHLRKSDAERLTSIFRRLKLEFGFPR